VVSTGGCSSVEHDAGWRVVLASMGMPNEMIGAMMVPITLDDGSDCSGRMLKNGLFA
jgi:hypothetical protein